MSNDSTVSERKTRRSRPTRRPREAARPSVPSDATDTDIIAAVTDDPELRQWLTEQLGDAAPISESNRAKLSVLLTP
jgi:hypothetical protein